MASVPAAPKTSGAPGTSEDELYWLALRMVQGLGTRRAVQLLERFPGPRGIFQASVDELEDAGLPGALARSVASGISFEEAADQHQKCREAGASLITMHDARYPELLRRIYDPPPLLYARGKVDLLQSVCVAVVGTRRPTPYGLAACEKLSGDLARAGATIVSGMARGIDSTAHKAALALQESACEGNAFAGSAFSGNTIAVLGCGVDVVYPTENRKLAAAVAARGLMVSEFPMGSAAFPQNFPIRNRIISGLSSALLVVEGAEYSGSSITARLAIDQGRDVFAVPGNITSRMSWGPNLLIKQGAKLVQDWNDIVVDLPAAAQRRLIEEGRQRLLNQGLGLDAERRDESAGPENASQLSEPQQKTARRIMEILKPDTAIHLDELVDKVDSCSPSEIIAALFELEILGLVKQLPGRNFVKVW
jgi:DNA processing protein